MNEERQKEICAAIEAMLFICGDPVAPDDLATALEVSKQEVLGVLTLLRARCEDAGSGLVLRTVDGKYQLATKPQFCTCIERLLQPTQRKSFSQSVLETLSIIAYKQPVTRAEIEAVRGVRCEYALNQLLQSGLIEVVGRKNTVGRPSQFGTTEKFLVHFGLESIAALPRRQEIRDAEEQESFDTV